MLRNNLLLASLPARELKRLDEELVHVDLPLKQVLHESERPIQHVYFPVSSFISMINEPINSDIVEVAPIGREGFAGLPIILAAVSMPSRAIVQVPGEAFGVGVPHAMHARPGEPDRAERLVQPASRSARTMRQIAAPDA